MAMLKRSWLMVLLSGGLAAEVAAKAPVSMAEEGAEDRQQDPAERAQARLEADPVGDRAAPLGGLHRALVLPAAHAHHRRALEKAPPVLELDQGDVVVVDRQHAEQQDPAAADRL